MTHPAKGSPEAKAWAQKMKKARIRASGRRTEKQFFGPRGEMQSSFYTKLARERREHPERFIAGIPRNPHGGPFDKDAARELELYATNHADLYRQMETPIRLNLEKKFKKGIYQSALAVKLWAGWADEAAKRYNKEFGGGGSKWFEMFSPATRLHVAKEQEAFHKGEMELGNFQVVSKRNPGERWHRGMEASARRYGRASREPLERAMYKGVEVAHGDSATAARRLGMNRPRTRRIPPERTRRTRRNPLAVFGVGNPERKRINCGIAGVVYSRCMEIRAEKTHYKPGLYKHPFSRKSGVQILALDNGDLLVHSTRGVNLWKPA